MAIITFWSNGREQTGKTLSLAAIATYLSIQHNIKVLVISTSDKDETLQNCFVPKQSAITGLFAPKSSNAAMQNGMDGLVRIARSNKVSPEMIRNYTKVIFNDALEILYSNKKNKEIIDNENGDDNTGNISEYYPDIIKTANQYYDMVFVDLDTNIDYKIQRQILQDSNLVIANVCQKLSSIDAFIKERKDDEILSSKKTMVLVGRYDRYSKYTSKNITRYMGEKRQVLSIPYNTLLYDAAEEAGIPDYFLNFVKNPNLDREDVNYLFFQEIRRAVESIQYKLQELQMKF